VAYAASVPSHILGGRWFGDADEIAKGMRQDVEIALKQVERARDVPALEAAKAHLRFALSHGERAVSQYHEGVYLGGERSITGIKVGAVVATAAFSAPAFATALGAGNIAALGFGGKLVLVGGTSLGTGLMTGSMGGLLESANHGYTFENYGKGFADYAPVGLSYGTGFGLGALAQAGALPSFGPAGDLLRPALIDATASGVGGMADRGLHGGDLGDVLKAGASGFAIGGATGLLNFAAFGPAVTWRSVPMRVAVGAGFSGGAAYLNDPANLDEVFRQSVLGGGMVLGGLASAKLMGKAPSSTPDAAAGEPPLPGYEPTWRTAQFGKTGLPQYDLPPFRLQPSVGVNDSAGAPATARVVDTAPLVQPKPVAAPDAAATARSTAPVDLPSAKTTLPVAPDQATPAAVSSDPDALQAPQPQRVRAGSPGPRTAMAIVRVTEAQQALESAHERAQPYRVRVKAAQGDLDAARDLAAEAGNTREARALVKQAEADLRLAKRALAPFDLDETTAIREQANVARARDEIARLENVVDDLDAQRIAELNPKGGFSAKERAEGRSPGVKPLLDAGRQPSGARYHELARQLAAARAQLQSEMDALTRTVSGQVAGATPGSAARSTTLDNASTLPDALKPIGGIPIDVTTGQPMQTGEWATDHIVSRTEIASDPRFLRCTPMQRDALLLSVPENYLPLTRQANSSKGTLTVEQWIAARARAGEPLPPEVAAAMRVADQRARAAIESLFGKFVPKK